MPSCSIFSFTTNLLAFKSNFDRVSENLIPRIVLLIFFSYCSSAALILTFSCFTVIWMSINWKHRLYTRIGPYVIFVDSKTLTEVGLSVVQQGRTNHGSHNLRLFSLKFAVGGAVLCRAWRDSYGNQSPRTLNILQYIWIREFLTHPLRPLAP